MADRLKDQCIDMLEKLAALTEIAEGNPFKIKAYKNAARTLAAFEGDFRSSFAAGELKNLPGVGKGILAVLAQVATDEHPNELDELSSIVPITLLDLLKIEGLGPKRARLLWQELDIKNLGELEYALKENRLSTLKGFSEKLCQNIALSVSEQRKNAGFFRLDQMMEAFLELKNLCGLSFDLAGATSRADECAQNLELSLLFAGPPAELVEIIKNNAQNTKFNSSEQFITFSFSKIPCKLTICTTPNAYGTHLLFHRCQYEFWLKLVAQAHKNSLSLTPEGLFKNSEIIAAPTEDDVFFALGIHPIAAERRDADSALIAKTKPLKKLIERRDLRGAFHNHTYASDGKNSLEEMRQKAIDLDLSYLSINDHSQSAFYAHGLKDDRLFDQLEAIEKLNADDDAKKCFLLSGTESDILADGSLDFDEQMLKKLDVVIASIHIRLKQNYEQMTQRMINAAKNPFTTIIGHPTGRLILDRPKSAFDMNALIQAAKVAGVALELNANPHRLDLDYRDLGLAKDASVLIAINADAHSVHGLVDLDYGIKIARKAGLTAEDVLNSMDLNHIKKWLQKKREKNNLI